MVWSKGFFIDNQKENSGKDLRAYFQFSGKEVMAKVALSGVSIEGAQKNLTAELPGWDFEKTKADAQKIWNKELSKIEVSSNDKKQLRTF